MSEARTQPDSTEEEQTDEQLPTAARNLTAFQQNILAILADEPLYGLAIKRELESYYGTNVNHGRLYPNLDQLVEMGLVEKGEIDKRTNEYALTDRGRETVLEQVEWFLDNYITGARRRLAVETLLERVG